MDLESSVLLRHGCGGSGGMDSGGPVNKRQIVYTNWLLLGLDVPSLERKYTIPFNRDMFNLPNKAGAEAVLYFLFTRLNPVMCKEEFRDCWPVRDKKSEALFYRTCNKWLRNIQKDEPDSRLPRINASLFMSPGGEKFYQLLFSFTHYVLQQVIKRECDVKSRDQLSWPQMTPHNRHLGDVMLRMLQCGVVQRRQRFLAQTSQSLDVGDQWRETASEYVRENRRLSKSIRDLEHQVRSETQRAQEKGMARGSPVSSRRSLGSEQERSSHLIKRAHRVQKVRDKWKKVDAFCNVETRERQVIESILDRTLHKYNIDAADISVKVPELLLRECEKEILKRHVDNTYEGGKLNILSLLQLWNLSLHLYIERFHQVGVVNLETESSHLTAAVQTHMAQITNANAFEKMLSEDFLPLLKQSVTRLKTKLEADTSFLHDTPQSQRTKSVGLGLLSATPPLSFTPKDDDSSSTHMMNITPRQDNVLTPEAADTIVATVAKSARKVAKTLFQGSPVYAPTFAMQGRLPTSTRVEGSRLPQPHRGTKGTPSRGAKVEKTNTAVSLGIPSRTRGTGGGLDASLHVMDFDSTPVHPSILTDVLSSTQPSTTPTPSPRVKQSSNQDQRQCDVSVNSPRQRSKQSDVTSYHGYNSPRSIPAANQERVADLPVTSLQYHQVDIELKTSLKPRQPSVDDFVDQVVSHVLDDEHDDDRENRPPVDFLHRLQTSFQDQDDFNTSNSNLNVSQSRGHASPRTLDRNSRKPLLQETLNTNDKHSNILQEIHATRDQFLPSKSSFEHSLSDNDKPEVFRHPEIPMDFVKNVQGDVSPLRRRQSCEKRSGSEVFRHPEIPEALSPELLPDMLVRRKSSRSQMDSDRINEVVSSLISQRGNFEVTTIIEKPTEAESPPACPERDVEARGSSVSSSPVVKIESPSISRPVDHLENTPAYNQQPVESPMSRSSTSDSQSPDKKLGSRLETEIRRMWRESLDGNPLGREATPAGMNGSLRSSYSQMNGSRTELHSGLFDLGGEDFTTLDDVTADVLLLSPENLADDDDTQEEVSVSHTAPFSYLNDDLFSTKTPQLPRRGVNDDLFSTKTPQLPRLGAKYSLYRTSMTSPNNALHTPTPCTLHTPTPCTLHTPTPNTLHTLTPNTLHTPTPNTLHTLTPGSAHKTPGRFDLETSPFLSQSLPMFSQSAKTKDISLPTSSLHESKLHSAIENDESTDFLVSLDDSFVPLRNGLQLEGKSPHKTAVIDSNHLEPSEDEIMARFHQLKQRVKQVLHPKQQTAPTDAVLEDGELIQSTSSSDERLMLALEEKYVKGLNSSYSLLEDETLDDIGYL